ncbi:hypothetical protein FISHEDRAFT_17490, partial [Fistulina hepatica ATCC 64428]
MLAKLPTELTLAILSYLQLPSVVSLRLVCRSWNVWILTNENTVYHNAAARQGYIPTSETHWSDVPPLYSAHALQGVDNWKKLCQRRTQINNSWRGYGPSRRQDYVIVSPGTHRIKVDEARGFIITSSSIGGIVITDLDTDSLLFALPPTYVRPWAHVEYGNGFLAFDRFRGMKEVWRCASDVTPESRSDVVEEARPDRQQEYAGATVAEQYETSSDHCRGHFRPWALLRAGDTNTTAFRLVYPTLLAAAVDTAYAWDVRTGVLCRRFNHINRDTWDPVADAAIGWWDTITYVDVGERYALVCGDTSLRLFRRDAEGDPPAALEVLSTLPWFGRFAFMIHPEVTYRMLDDASVLDVQRLVCDVHHEPPHNQVVHNMFMAAHMSSCGRHLIALLETSVLVVVPDFERVIRGEATVHDVAFSIALGSQRRQAKYLDYVGDKAVAVTYTGVFVVHFRNLEVTPPLISVARVRCFSNPSLLNRVTCVQRSDTGLYVTWNPDEEA